MASMSWVTAEEGGMTASGVMGELTFTVDENARAKTYALEVWMPSCESYVRFAECSDTADFIARRMGIRYRQDAKDKPHIAHIISGTLNISCVFNAILENNQNGDGTVNVPECLKAAMKTELISK